MSSATRRLWLIHVLLNVALAFLVWLWLGIPDARTWQLGITAVFGLGILFVFLWLHGSTFRYFSENEPLLPPAFRHSLKRLPVFAVWAALWIGFVMLVQRWTPSGKGASALQWALTWIIIPAVLLPLGAAVMGHGRPALAAYRNARYWLWAIVLLIAGLYVPYRLVLWVPTLTGFAMEAASFAIRWLAAYLIFVTAWLTLAYVSSGGSPRFSQPNTASLP